MSPNADLRQGQIPIWKDRRFQQRRTCSKTADCSLGAFGLVDNGGPSVLVEILEANDSYF